MRMSKVSFLLLSGLSFLIPNLRIARGDRPPVCCPSPGVALFALNESGDAITPEGQFVVSDQMLRSQGITRSQYVDQLSKALFPDKVIDLVLPSKKVLRLGKANGKDLDKMNQVGLTDGVSYVAISFVR